MNRLPANVPQRPRLGCRMFESLLPMKYPMVLLLALLPGRILQGADMKGSAAKPPAPYTPVKASSSQFRCLGRETKLGPLL